MNYQVEVSPAIFNSVYIKHLENMARVQIFYGGAGSGKSVFVAQRAILDLMKGGRNYLVCRQVARTINRSVYNEITKVISNFGVHELFTINKSDFTITCRNGYQILFVGLDDTEKIKSITPKKGVLTDVVVDEATETERDTIKQLLKRQRGGDDKIKKRLTLLFNPVLQSHWLYTDFFIPAGWTDSQTEYASPELSIQKTWYIHNRFLTPDDVKDLENEKDKYYYNVYTLGEWGILGNVIFTNWRIEDLSEMHAQFTNTRNGLDFGFSSDPAAMPCMHYDRMRKTVYIFDELYERGLTNDLLAVEIKNRIGDDRVICDSAEPKSIAELNNYGVSAIGARKGKDSVLFGIQWLQQQAIVIDSKCINARNEFTQYHWKVDKNGNAIREPVDRNNHLIDGARYGLEDDMEETWTIAGSRY